MAGYFCNGSDLLLYIDGVAFGHCTTHTTTLNSDTKERAFKPTADKSKSSGLWKGVGVTGLSISISAEGLCYNGEEEEGYAKLLKIWKTGASIQCKCMERELETPYLQGNFVITSLERTDPAQDDATYSLSLDNDGEPDILDDTAFDNDAEHPVATTSAKVATTSAKKSTSSSAS